MTSTHPKQLATAHIVRRYRISGLCAMWLFFPLTFALKLIDSKGFPPISTICAALAVITLLSIPFSIALSLAVRLCKQLASAAPDDLYEVEIHCVKVRLLISRWGGKQPYKHTHFYGAELTDDQGRKYVYILEEELEKDNENCAPYKAKKGCTVRLFCYRGTNLVGKIQ